MFVLGGLLCVCAGRVIMCLCWQGYYVFVLGVIICVCAGRDNMCLCWDWDKTCLCG